MWAPGAREDVAKVAVPVALRLTEPRIAPPSTKLTEPVRLPPLPVTLADSVRFCPATDGLALVDSVVTVVDCCTVTVMEFDVAGGVVGVACISHGQSVRADCKNRGTEAKRSGAGDRLSGENRVAVSQSYGAGRRYSIAGERSGKRERRSYGRSLRRTCEGNSGRSERDRLNNRHRGTRAIAAVTLVLRSEGMRTYRKSGGRERSDALGSKLLLSDYDGTVVEGDVSCWECCSCPSQDGEECGLLWVVCVCGGGGEGGGGGAELDGLGERGGDGGEVVGVARVGGDDGVVAGGQRRQGEDGVAGGVDWGGAELGCSFAEDYAARGRGNGGDDGGRKGDGAEGQGGVGGADQGKRGDLTDDDRE